MAYHFEKLSDRQRADLSRARAESWRGPLSVDEFIARNECHYAHPYGRTIQTFGLFEGEKLQASLDALPLPLLVTDGKGHVATVENWHLASVLTLPAFRKQGVGSALIRAYFDHQKPTWSTLFSGIGAAFYERFGYHVSPAWHVQQAAVASKTRPWQVTEIDAAAFDTAQTHFRKQLLLKSSVPVAAFSPGLLWWDWYAEIYGYFASLRKHAVARGRFWRVESDAPTAWVAGLENWASGHFDVWWVSREEPAVTDFLCDFAFSQGLSHANWWTHAPAPGAKAMAPMLRGPTGARPLLDSQLGDWW